MTNEKLIEETVEKITDYGYNDEYGYYNDWADGVRPLILSALTQDRLDALEEVLRGMPEEYKISGHESIGIDGGKKWWNACRSEVIKMIEDLKNK